MTDNSRDRVRLPNIAGPQAFHYEGRSLSARMESGILPTNVGEVVVVAPVNDSGFDVSEEVETASPFDSGTEVAAVEEVADEEHTRSLERMLSAVHGGGAHLEPLSFRMPGKQLPIQRSRKGRGRKRRWGTKSSSSSRNWKKYAMDSVKDEQEDGSGDDDDDDYVEVEGLGRMLHRKPKKRLFAHRLQWSNNNMENAMRDVQEQNMTLRGAAKKHNVPYSTLKDRIQGRVVHGTKPGVKTVLSPEEEKDLVVSIQQLEASGFHLHCTNIRELARQMLLMRASRGCNMPYRDGCPGHNWLAGFLKRHPDIQIKRSLNRNLMISALRQKQMLKKFFDIVSRVYKKTQLHHKPGCIFSFGEIKLTTFPRASVIVATNACGVPLAPFIVLRGVGSDADRSALSSQPEYRDAVFFNSRGRREEDILLTWFRDHFLRCRQIQHGQPSILLIGRPVCDISLRFVQLADEENVMLVSVPGGISHLVQPLTSALLRYINGAITYGLDRSTTQLQQQDKTSAVQLPSRSLLASVLSEVWANEWPLADIKHDFSQNGVYPLNPRAISNDRIVESMPDNAEDGSDIKEEADEEDEDCSSNDDDDDSASDVAAHGLNLLSELSTMEHLQDSSGHSTTTRSVSLKQEPGDEVAVDAPVVVSNQCGSGRPRVSEELMKCILGRRGEEAVEIDAGQSRTVIRQQSRTSADVCAEIAASRINFDQINRAVSSITDDRASSQGQAALPVRNYTTTAAQRLRNVITPDVIKRHRHSRQLDSAVLDCEPSGGQSQQYIIANVSVEEVVANEDDSDSVAMPSVQKTGKTNDQVIEHVDLSDLYVHVEETNATRGVQAEPKCEHPSTNNNAKSPSAGSAGARSIIHCDLKQLATQVRPDQKVDLIQNVVIGGRTVQIIRRMAFQDVIRSNGAALEVEIKTDEAADNDGSGGHGEDYCGDIGEVEVVETSADCEFDDNYLQTSVCEEVV